MKMNNFFNEPFNIMEKDFCNKYIDLSESYWDMADEDLMKAIENAKDEILINLSMGKDYGSFSSMTQEQIIAYFENKKIEIISQIPDSIAKYAQKELSKLLAVNRDRANKCNMTVPNKPNELLTVRQYYQNYLLALEYLKRLRLIMGNKKGGF